MDEKNNSSVPEEDTNSTSAEEVVTVNEEKVESTEVKPSVAVTNEKEKSKSFFEKNKAVIVIAGVAVIGIILIILLCVLVKSLFFGSKNVENPLVYLTSDGTLKFVTSSKKEGITIANSYSDSVDVVYSNKSNKYILYTKSDNLYLVNTTKNSGESEKITSDVDDFMFSEDDKYVVFTDEDGDLYSYNFKDKEKLDSEISSIIGVTKNRVFYKKDGNLYMRSLKASKDDKVKIVADYKYAYLNEDGTKILYSKENDDDLYDYYVYNIKSQKGEKVISDAYTVYSYNDDYTKFVYGVKNEGAKFDLSKIVDDDKLEDDKNFKAYTASDYIDGIIDYETYRDNLSEKYDVADRNSIREQLKKEYELSATMDIYYQSGNKKTKVVEEVDKILYANADTGRVVYNKVTYNTNNKIKLSEVNYFYKIKNHLDDCKEKAVMFKVGDKEAVEITSGVEKDASIYVINNDLYYTLDDELFYAKINGNKLGKVSSLAEDVDVIDSTGTYKDSLIIATDVKSYTGDLKLVKSGKVEAIASDVYTSYVQITDTNKIYYFTDYSDRSGDFNVYNGKSKKLMTDISGVKYVKDNFMYVIKDYSSTAGTYDLYKFTGNAKKLKLIETDVKSAY